VHPGERLSVLALRQLDEIAGRAQLLLEKNRAIVDQFLDSRQDLEAVRPGAGTIVFPRLRQGTADKLCAMLKEKFETSVVPGSFFEMPAHFRLGLGGDSETLAEGLKRLGKALDEYAQLRMP